MKRMLQDASLIQTAALPEGATGAPVATNVTGFDLGGGDHAGNFELLVSLPALTTAELPDTETMTVSIETDDNADFSSASIIVDKAVVQTGASGAGAAAKSARVGLPSDVERYVRAKATISAGGGDCSAKKLTAGLVF